MSYKILSIILLTGMFTAMPAVAQKDAKAKEILDKTSAVFNQSGGLSASFSVNVNDALNKIKQSFEGKILVKGEKFHLETPDQEISFDGKTQWVYDKSIQEISILNPQPQDIQTLNPVSVFEMYKTDCDYKYKGETVDIQKRKVHEVSLFPKKKNGDITQVDIQINPSDWMPVFFRIIYKNKLEYRIYINKYQTQLNFPDSQFVFDTKKYPQANVNDLR
jgi:outer membrane lipoprotein-sorting protein